MARLTRAQQQDRTRAAVMAAARVEFSQRGYVEAKVDRIAERAELTRGAVYANFPSKRAMYLAVQVDMVERRSIGVVPPLATADALEAFARVWLERLPLAGDASTVGHLHPHSLTGVFDDAPARAALAQIGRLEALLLARALEADSPPRTPPARQVRLAELVLTMLNGAAGLAETAPGFGDPFDVARACQHLAGLELTDVWDPPHLPFVSPATPADDPWTPPAGLLDVLGSGPVDLGADGVIAALGTHRLGAAEEAVRASRPGELVTLVVVTRDPAEMGRLVRLRLSDIAWCLRQVFTRASWAPLRLVVDEHAVIATALGVPDVSDATEAAVRIQDGTIVATAIGRGAVHAAATAVGTARSPEPGR